jgi:hypothetical protein
MNRGVHIVVKLVRFAAQFGVSRRCLHIFNGCAAWLLFLHKHGGFGQLYLPFKTDIDAIHIGEQRCSSRARLP